MVRPELTDTNKNKAGHTLSLAAIRSLPWLLAGLLMLSLAVVPAHFVVAADKKKKAELPREQIFYRFTSDAGVLVMKSTITPKEAQGGYSVVNIHGRVIETVEPALTDEEYATLSEERRRALEAKKLEEEQQRYDESLLLRYSSIEDLEADRQRKLSEFDVRMSILRSNMASLKEQVERQQAVAANIERQGRNVPPVIRDNIIDLEEKVRDAERSLASRVSEKEKVDTRFDKDAERFETLIAEIK